MKKIMIIVLFMLVSLMTPVAAQASVGDPTPPGSYSCHLYSRTDHDVRRVSFYASDTKWYVSGKTQFLVCRRLGHKTYSLPIASTVKYNRNGSHMFCNPYVPLQHPIKRMRGNAVYNDAFGNTFNPGDFYAGCSKSTVSQKTQYYHDAKKMYWHGDRAPRWTIWWAMQFDGAWTTSPHGAFHGTMRPIV